VTETLKTEAQELVGQANALLAQIKAIHANKDASAEERGKIPGMLEDVKGLKARAAQSAEITQLANELEAETKAAEAKGRGLVPPGAFKSLGEFYISVYNQTFSGQRDARLKTFRDKDEPTTAAKANAQGWLESTKDLVEAIGASGGFLVPTEQGETLYMLPAPEQVVRPRCTRIPMRRRSIQYPALDQSGTTSGQPHWYGGLLAKWTEEATAKSETQPKFRQLTLTAHKLVCYTEVGDELLEDAAVSLEALLQSMFSGAINWYEEEAFIAGTGAGQPQGVITAGATINVGRAVAGAVGLTDVVTMLERSMGTGLVWLANRQLLSNLLLLNGPAANPSYVFMPSAREGMPNTLFGYPLVFSEHCPVPGVTGDIILADWKYYLVGDRQATTVDSSKHYQFQNDITSWRAVHRVDGQPWMNAPMTQSDGATQISPFVVLSGVVGS
jgi:HK97 family phage major capsid protein